MSILLCLCYSLYVTSTGMRYALCVASVDLLSQLECRKKDMAPIPFTPKLPRRQRADAPTVLRPPTPLTPLRPHSKTNLQNTKYDTESRLTGLTATLIMSPAGVAGYSTWDACLGT